MRKMYYLLFTVCSILLFNKTFAQNNRIFIKATDGTNIILDGGSIVPGHTKEIETFAYSYGMQTCYSPGCHPSLQDFSFTMQLNPGSVTAKKLLLSGTHIAVVDVFLTKQTIANAYFPYYKIHMEDVAISSISEGSASEVPTFNLTFTPGRIAWANIAVKADGTAGAKTTYGWNAETNAEWIYNF